MIKPKLIPVVVGAIACTLIQTPHLKAQSQVPFGLPEQLNFTPKQLAKLQQAQVSLDAQIKGILTPAQWNRFQSVLAQGASQAVALSSLKLNPQQTTRLKKAEMLVTEQLDDILSKQQKKQLVALRESEQPVLTADPAINPSPPIPTTDLQTALQLTPAQATQLQNIQALLQGQMKAILTPSQWTQLQTLKATGQAPNLSTLKLSSAQTTQIREAEGLAQQRLLTLLSPEQQQKLATLAQSRNSAPAPLLASTAVPANPPPIQTAQAPQTNPTPPANPLSSLNLSPAQEAQIQKIDVLIQAQVQGVLKPAQWTELQTLQAAGASKGAALAKLNLSPAQITQLREIEAIAQQRLLSILNAEQRKKLQEGRAIPSTPPPAAPPTTPPSQPQSSTPSALASLNLTTDQQAQVQQVQTLATAQIQSILTPEQWQQLQTLQSANLSQAAALQQINLTGDQKSKLQEVEVLAQQRILSILTAEQKKKLLNP